MLVKGGDDGAHAPERHAGRFAMPTLRPLQQGHGGRPLTRWRRGFFDLSRRRRNEQLPGTSDIDLTPALARRP
jgi:hypothetical protein